MGRYAPDRRDAVRNDNIKLQRIDIPQTDKKRLVIIGGGFGGLNVAKEVDSDIFQTILLDKNNYHTFQPLLYQVAGAGLEPESICSPIRKILEGKKDFHFLLLKVERVDLAFRRIYSDKGFLEYDYLVAAVGAETNFFGNVDFASKAFPLKEMVDSIALRNQIFSSLEAALFEKDKEKRNALMTFVIVGGGATGVELAGALAELKHHILPKDYPDLNIDEVSVFLVEGMPRLLSGMSDTAGNSAQRYLEQMGVKVLLNTRMIHYDGVTLSLTDKPNIGARTVVWAAGVSANAINGFSSSSMDKRRLKVNRFNQVLVPTGFGFMDNVFAVGDACIMTCPGYEKGLPGMAPVATQQGRLLAQNLLRKETQKPMKPFTYKNKGTMATVGRNLAVADMKHSTFTGFVGWMLWMAVHLWYLIGFRNKALVLVNWIWSYFTYDRGVRLIVPQKSNELCCRNKCCDLLTQRG
jgi:NADH dehydrogenase